MTHSDDSDDSLTRALDPGFRALAQFERQHPMPPGPVPPAIMRDGYRMMRKAQDKSPPTNLEVRDLEIPGGETPILARLYAPMGAAAATGLLVYFHGGGFVVGDLETHDGHCRRMASLSGHRVLAINYRLAPEHPFPAAHDDAVAVTRWAVDNAAALGADSRRVAVGGDSAGANLAASTALEMMNDAHRRLCFQLLLYPLTFPETETASRRAFDGPVISRAMLAGAAMAFAHRGHPAARRALLDARDFSGAPPAHVVTAGVDPLRDEGRALAGHLARDGVKATHVEYPGLVHEFFLMPDVSTAVLPASKEVAAVLASALA